MMQTNVLWTLFWFYNFKCTAAVKVNYDQAKNIYNKDISPLAPGEKKLKTGTGHVLKIMLSSLCG